MKHENDDIIKRVEKAKKLQKKLTHITDKATLSTEDKMKLGLCKHFVQFALIKRLKLKAISDITHIPITRLSEITNYKIKKFTVDQLIKHLTTLAKHDAQIREFLIFLEQAAELPMLKVWETKKLTKGIRKASKNGSRFAHG